MKSFKGKVSFQNAGGRDNVRLRRAYERMVKEFGKELIHTVRRCDVCEATKELWMFPVKWKQKFFLNICRHCESKRIKLSIKKNGIKHNGGRKAK
ncbi:hypothetical protein CH380_19380 [Leptospira adleri]|uniref:Uncharacterized protein n=1 Tax=Leptospira adleri TaxID=2023186 RepID=A0A2M9YJC5_9LEPT|nr:hypothetical protein CH380_19380 [Leptospira adleri]PJZ61881.1 hypothetical protein CH376_10785 [Leptospira adleri]